MALRLRAEDGVRSLARPADSVSTISRPHDTLPRRSPLPHQLAGAKVYPALCAGRSSQLANPGAGGGEASGTAQGRAHLMLHLVVRAPNPVNRCSHIDNISDESLSAR